MTETIPTYQDQITFNCPQNLLDQFIYNETAFILELSEHENRMDIYDIDLKVNGALKGVTLDRLWECILSRRAYLELEAPKTRGRGRTEGKGKIPKILVLDLTEGRRYRPTFRRARHPKARRSQEWKDPFGVLPISMVKTLLVSLSLSR